ncbi:MAG: hypothetical protein R3D85_12520 [Paracoccaceae bacterium]
MIGFATLLVGGFSRFGVWRQIVSAIVILTLIKLIQGLVADPVRADAGMWPLMYLPSIAGLIVAVALLAWSRRNHRLPRAAGLPAAEAPA